MIPLFRAELLAIESAQLHQRLLIFYGLHDQATVLTTAVTYNQALRTNTGSRGVHQHHQS